MSGNPAFIELARDPREATSQAALESWFVAEPAFMEFFEEFEEEGAYPDHLGKSVLATARQYPRLFSTVGEVARFLSIQAPEAFVYEGYAQVCDSEGIRRPRLEVSARLLRNCDDDELRHVIAKEMFHIYSGHIRLEVMTEKVLGLINAIPNLPGLSIVRQFGGSTAFEVIGFNMRNTAFRWFEKACFSAENFAISYVGNPRASINATLLGVLNERTLVNELSLDAYMEQAGAIETCQGPMATLEKINEVVPYGPYRVINMLRFFSTMQGAQLFGHCRATRTER